MLRSFLGLGFLLAGSPLVRADALDDDLEFVNQEITNCQIQHEKDFSKLHLCLEYWGITAGNVRQNNTSFQVEHRAHLERVDRFLETYNKQESRESK